MLWHRRKNVGLHLVRNFCRSLDLRDTLLNGENGGRRGDLRKESIMDDSLYHNSIASHSVPDLGRHVILVHVVIASIDDIGVSFYIDGAISPNRRYIGK